MVVVCCVVLDQTTRLSVVVVGEEDESRSWSSSEVKATRSQTIANFIFNEVKL